MGGDNGGDRGGGKSREGAGKGGRKGDEVLDGAGTWKGKAKLGKGDEGTDKGKGKRKNEKGSDSAEIETKGKGKGKSEKGSDSAEIETKGKGKGKSKGKERPEKLVEQNMRGTLTNMVAGKPSGFIRRCDEAKDVYFDLAEVIDGSKPVVGDILDFDIVVVGEGDDGRLYARRVKKAPEGATLEEARKQLSKPVVQAAAKGSLTGALTGLGPGGSLKPAASLKPGGSLTGGVSLRPGGGMGGLGGADKSTGAEKKTIAEDLSVKGGEGSDGVLFGRVVSVRGAFGFLQPLGTVSERGDIFFRAPDVIGMNCDDVGEEGLGLEIKAHNGHRRFWLNDDDEVSYEMSTDHHGQPCAVNVMKERRGAWRIGRDAPKAPAPSRKEPLKDQVKRLVAMSPDEVMQNASLFREVLDNPEFNPSHLYAIVSLLASNELMEEARSDNLYRLFLQSKPMQASLRTTVIKQSQAPKHSGDFLEDCLKLFTELILRAKHPEDVRNLLPLRELLEAIEQQINGGSISKKGMSEEMERNLVCIQRFFPELPFESILGKNKKQGARTACDAPTEIMEADWYSDMPILPLAVEVLGRSAFEIEENMSTYEQVEDYIHTHFMLLREDYIEPLREGISLFFEGNYSPKDLHIYDGMTVAGLSSTWEGLVYRIKLRQDQVRKVNWEKSKHLMYGSLLCLSDDNFETLIWATVWRRDEQLIKSEAQLDIVLPFEPYNEKLCPGKKFICIENVMIYFEAYRHVLQALQSMRPVDVPFQNVLMSPSPDRTPPSFVTPETDMWHFHNSFASCEKTDCATPAPKSFQILQQWPEALRDSLDIDPSQLDALRHALTSQVGLIQGPPGTGKTYVGLKIVQTLLDNTAERRRSPLLIVCYTNHALDQFLEGIFSFCERIARIGSRSKSEVLQARNLRELVGELQPSREWKHARWALMGRRDALRKQLCKLAHDVDKHVVEWADMRGPDGLMERMQRTQLLDGYLEYLGETPKPVTDDDDSEDENVSEEYWQDLMKAWLETDDLSKIAASLVAKNSGTPSAAETIELGSWEELAADDALGEEEAEQLRQDRSLDVEPEDAKSVKKNELYIELTNSWLCTQEQHLEKLKPDLRNFDWREEDLWQLPIPQRRETYRRWLLDSHHKAREELPEIARQLQRNAENRAALERDRKLALLREMNVVGMTTTAVSKYQQLVKELRPEIVIVEEAAEVLEAHILTALHPQTQHVVLIGDHQQLRPSTAVYRLSKHFHLDVSMFERLIKNGAAHVTLEQQRRMHPKISRLIKPLYPRLRDHFSVSEYPEVSGIASRCFFLTHSNFEDMDGESHSKSNSFEADFVAALALLLIQKGYDSSQITVISPYLGQVRILRQKLRSNDETSGIRVAAVDNFQGEENDIILLSLVRSNREGHMGFLAVENRICVSLTRAKHGMFIVGNKSMLDKHPLWTKIMGSLREDKSIAEKLDVCHDDRAVQVKSAQDIYSLLDPEQAKKWAEIHAAAADRWAELGNEDSRKSQKERKRENKGKGGKGSEKGGGSKGSVARHEEIKSSKNKAESVPEPIKTEPPPLPQGDQQTWPDLGPKGPGSQGEEIQVKDGDVPDAKSTGKVTGTKDKRSKKDKGALLFKFG